MAERVRDATTRLLQELNIEKNISNPYWLPYASYVMSWQFHIPIHTIIIGQNPYPQVIYPDYGSAFAYDEKKSRKVPGSIQVIAQDLYNFNKTDKDLSISCFRDSWRLLEIGVVMINETVFDKISLEKKNTLAIKEMEAQVRALQVLISESYFAGQDKITCIGMGIPAAAMTSIVRQWCPKDLVSARIITCSNPAAIARSIGDLPSQDITIGKTIVSKLLAFIVNEFEKMPPAKTSQSEKRRQQNIDALKKSSENLQSTSTGYDSELKSLEERFRSLDGNQEVKATIDELADAIGSLRKVVNAHRNAMSAHNLAFLMVVESMGKTNESVSTDRSNIQSPSSASIQTPIRGGPRRRGTTPLNSTPAVPSINEGDEPPMTPTSSVAPSRARRRNTRTPSYAPSNADSEYTVDSTATNQRTTSDSNEMSIPESIAIRSFATWCKKNVTKALGDPTYEEILNSAAENRSVVNDFSKELLEYVRQRKKDSSDYDEFDELASPDSDSTMWITKQIPGLN